VAEAWVPSIQLREIPGGCRLSLGGWAHGAGPTLQDALDDLVASVLDLATAMRDGGLVMPREAGAPDHRWLDFLARVAERAREGEDARRLLLDGPD
jgi:hypothetical protein